MCQASLPNGGYPANRNVIFPCYNASLQNMSPKKYLLYLMTGLLVLCHLPVSTAEAQGPAPYKEPDSGAVVCPPGVYFESPGDCLPAGPPNILHEMARLGLEYPPRALASLSGRIRR